MIPQMPNNVRASEARPWTPFLPVELLDWTFLDEPGSTSTGCIADLRIVAHVDGGDANQLSKDTPAAKIA
jgi:hypothetical protein